MAGYTLTTIRKSRESHRRSRTVFKRKLLIGLSLGLALIFLLAHWTQGSKEEINYDIYTITENNQEPTIGLEPDGSGKRDTIQVFLAGRQSPLSAEAHVFVEAGSYFGLDPYLLVGIAGAESSFGKHRCADFNSFGFGSGGCISFQSHAEAIWAVAKTLATRPYYAEFRRQAGGDRAAYLPVLAYRYTGGEGANWQRIVGWTMDTLINYEAKDTRIYDQD